MADLDLTAATQAGGAALAAYNTSQGLHFVVHQTDSDDTYGEIARVVVEAAAPLIERVVRERAAQELMAWAETKEPLSSLRRHIGMCARRIGPKMTDREVVEALQRGDFAVCHLDEAGRSIPLASRGDGEAGP